MSQGTMRSRGVSATRRWAAIGIAAGLALSTVALVAPTVSAQDAAPLKIGAGVGEKTVSGNAYLPGAFTVNVGDTVMPGQVLATLYDPTHMQLVASVREMLTQRLKVEKKLKPAATDASAAPGSAGSAAKP